MFKEAEFRLLPGIAVFNAGGNNTPGPAPVIPKHPGSVPSGTSSIITVTTYNKQRELFRRYKNMQELVRQAIQKAYPEGDYLLDLEDEYGSIVLKPREVWEHLWKTYVPDEQKDDAIIENEQEIKAAYDPSLPITVF